MRAAWWRRRLTPEARSRARGHLEPSFRYTSHSPFIDLRRTIQHIENWLSPEKVRIIGSGSREPRRTRLRISGPNNHLGPSKRVLNVLPPKRQPHGQIAPK